MRDLEHLKELFNYDELLRDFGFTDHIYTSGKQTTNKFSAIEYGIVWGDLV